MKNHAGQIVLLIASVGLLGAVAASYIRPLHGVILFSDSSKYVVSLDDARCRIVRLTADFTMTYSGETPLDYLAKTWKTGSIQPLAWQSIDYPATDQGRCQALAFSFPLFVPTVLAFLLFLIGRVRAKQPGRLMRLLQEVVHPSDRFITSRFRRLVRRSFVLVCCLGAMLIAALMYVPNQLLTKLPRSFDFGALHGGRLHPSEKTIMIMMHREPLSFTTPHAFVSVSQARLGISYYGRALNGEVPKSRSFAFAGFSWTKGSYDPPMTCGSGAPQLTPAEQSYLDQTEPYQLSMSIPLGIPLALSLIPPLVLFVRRPWRRSKRSLYGWCLKCGYDLTGLPEPRCPECGTATSRARIHAEASRA